MRNRHCSIQELAELLGMHPAITAVQSELSKRGEKHLLLTGLYASARAMMLAAIAKEHGMLVIVDNQEDAQYLYADMAAVSDKVLFFPTSQRRRQGRDEAMMIQRTEVLTALSRSQGDSYVVITSPEAMAEPVPQKEQLQSQTIRLKTEDERDPMALCREMAEMGFERVDFVYQPGQYALRGCILDVYSYSHDDPYRIDYIGNEIDSIRCFDIETQLSKEKVGAIDITGLKDEKEEKGRFVDYVDEHYIWVSNDWQVVHFRWESTIQAGRTPLGDEGKTTIELRDSSYYPTHTAIRWNTMPQRVFHKQLDLLQDDLKEKTGSGWKIYILADQKKQTDRLAAIFAGEEEAVSDGQGKGIEFVAVDKALHAGFEDRDLKIACYTDHEIFERYHRVTLRSENARRGQALITLKELNELRMGDYVVHSDHGIGKFGGLVTTMVNGKPQEMIKLLYRGGDSIFVSIHNLHRISKYKGKEGSEPTISQLGSGAWERLKERTKDKVKAIARDLIRLYAARKQQGGFAYSPDSYMQHEMEASFEYEDTIDQAKATLDVKKDMESRKPMDRLICGDVGFGKTEIAMRAAFKAATDGKQVAVLVPTTVLAMQHYQSFKARMENFPVTIEYLSRAKSGKEVKEIEQRLADGKIDILIGTHKLVGKSVKWKELGLLIIDEEQKFGVAVKEKLKQLRCNVDVLTLTATPIPRTLQFSLLGARDLSVMTTPPQNRYPVQTEQICTDDEDIIKEAIDIELERNGQVFVVSNRIEMLPRLENKLHRLCPEARIITAHGQMPIEETEKRLTDFINYEYDILISTTIIESGIDIPNVNTMFVFAAQNYGLADLHQLRGRVGRSNRKAYCYLVTPDRELITADARRRLDALCTFAELGSGFNLAMQDLDIRGAGNLLGSEQSGFIADLGYETYQKILNEAVQELKEEIGETANGTESGLDKGGRRQWCPDCQLESDLQICFPAEYIENISERIALYRELDSMRNEDELTAFSKRLLDRFGPLPQEAEELLNVVRLRWLCCELGIEKIYLKSEQMTLYFTSNNDRYWQSEAFGWLVQYAVKKADRCQLKEEVDRQGKKTGKRYMTIQNVRTIDGARTLLGKTICN